VKKFKDVLKYLVHVFSESLLFWSLMITAPHGLITCDSILMKRRENQGKEMEVRKKWKWESNQKMKGNVKIWNKRRRR
jgi:hypothetical protein